MIDASKATRFVGRTSQEALEKVKAVYGAEAVILGVQRIRTKAADDGDAQFEVLAGPPAVKVPSPCARNLLDRAYGAQRTFTPEPAKAAEMDHMPLFIDQDEDDTEDETDAEAPVAPGTLADIRNMVADVLRLQMQGDRPLVPEEYSRLYLRMVENEVGAHLARRLIEKLYEQAGAATRDNPEAVRAALREAIGRLVPATGEIRLREGRGTPTVVAFVGPTGVGKTTSVAKLAIAFRTRLKHKVGIITEDANRPGGTDPLRMVNRIIGVPLAEANTPEQLVQALRQMRDMDLILVDTAGRSPRATGGIGELRQFLAAGDVDETHLVLPCTGGTRHLQDVAEQFLPLKYNRMMFTKLDEAAAYGIILNVAATVDCALSYVTTGQEYASDIEPGSAERLARLVMGDDRC